MMFFQPGSASSGRIPARFSPFSAEADADPAGEVLAEVQHLSAIGHRDDLLYGHHAHHADGFQQPGAQYALRRFFLHRIKPACIIKAGFIPTRHFQPRVIDFTVVNVVVHRQVSGTGQNHSSVPSGYSSSGFFCCYVWPQHIDPLWRLDGNTIKDSFWAPRKLTVSIQDFLYRHDSLYPCPRSKGDSSANDMQDSYET